MVHRRSGRRRWPARDDAPSLGRRLLLGAAAAGALCLAGAVLDGGPGRWSWLVWPGLTLGCAVVLGRLEPLAARRRREQLMMETPQALELMAACLAAGMPIRTAGRAVAVAFDGPVGEDLDRALALAELGTSDAQAWLALRDHPQLGPAAQDLARSVESGTMMVEGLRHHADGGPRGPPGRPAGPGPGRRRAQRAAADDLLHSVVPAARGRADRGLHAVRRTGLSRTPMRPEPVDGPQRPAISTARIGAPERYQQISSGPHDFGRRHETPGASDRMQHPRRVRTSRREHEH